MRVCQRGKTTTHTPPTSQPTQALALDRLTWQLIPALLGAWNYANALPKGPCDLPDRVAAAIEKAQQLIGDRRLYDAKGEKAGAIPDAPGYGFCPCSLDTCKVEGYPDACKEGGSSCAPPIARKPTDSGKGESEADGPCPDLDPALSDELAKILAEWNAQAEQCG